MQLVCAFDYHPVRPELALSVAFVMTLLYDWVLTFGEEVEFVWQQKMKIGSVLFLLNRYIPMIYLVISMNSYTNRAIREDKFCRAWIYLDIWIRVLCNGLINVLLLLRTWALWEKSRTILIFLSVLLMVCMLAASSQSLYSSLTIVQIPLLNSIRPCLFTVPNADFIYGSLVSCIVFDSAVLILTLVKAVPARQPDGLTPLITQLLKDGVQYFVVLFLIAIANIIMAGHVPPALATTLFTLYSVTTSTLGCRLILNLRGSILHTASDDDGDLTTKLNTLIFNRHSDDPTVTVRDRNEDLEGAS